MKAKKPLSPIRMIGLGFAVIIFAGAALLMLPVSVKEGAISFIDALFTAASATCVTGLVIYDTYSKFTLFGQGVILTLIQVGGLGFITITVMFAAAMGKKIGLRDRAYLAEAVSSGQIGGVTRYAGMILKGTALIEGAGALLLAARFIPRFGVAEGIWCGVFHSVSAFCNAGFDILGRIEPSSSLTHFQNDPYVLLIISALVIIGGIGFFVWDDIRQNGFKWKSWRLHTKLMITATAALLTIPAVIFLITEWNGQYAHMAVHDKILNAFFQSVTTRTAGFNSTDYTKYSPAGYALTVFLMIIGAGAGSTGGGIKVTTFLIVALSVRAAALGLEDINVYGRRIDRETVSKAYTGMSLFAAVMLIGAFVLMLFDGIEMQTALFEAASAMGTVGLSSGVTSSLGIISKIAVILMMYSGRVGSMSLAMSVVKKSKMSKIKYPEEKVVAG